MFDLLLILLLSFKFLRLNFEIETIDELQTDK